MRLFHTTRPLFDAVNHPNYKNVDWIQVYGGSYAVVNPYDSSDILYLTPREFKVHIRVAATQEINIIILATPHSKQPGGPEKSGSSITPLPRVGYTNQFITFLRSFTQSAGSLAGKKSLIFDRQARKLEQGRPGQRWVG